MDSETIEAIANLWPLALIVFLLINSFLFKTQIAVFIDRFSKIQIRKGNTEVVIVKQDNEEREDITSKKGILEDSGKQDISEDAPASEKEEQIEINNLSKEELNREMFFAFYENNVDRANEIFIKLQTLEEDQSEKYRNESYFLYLSFSKGDTEALVKLNQLEEKTKFDPISNSTVCFYIGRCYERVSQFEKAISAYKKSSSLIEDEPQKANSIMALSNCYYSLDKIDIAFSSLEEGIQQFSNPEALSKLYLAIADLFKRIDNKNMRAIALEKALEYQPNNSYTLFDTAYAYSDGDFKHLSLYHYKNLINFFPNHRVGLNNLGVVYSSLQMPIHSVKNYKNAWLQKETLAAANLAYQYLKAGFWDEAQNILSEAKFESDIHPNVGSALSDLSKREEEETKNEQKIVENAIEQQRFLLKFAESYLTMNSTTVDISGSWFIGKNISIFTQEGSQITGTWGEDGNKKKFSGKLKNLGAVLKFEKWGYSLSKMSMTFVDDCEGYAYLSSDFHTLSVMVVRKSEIEYLTFSQHNLDESLDNKIDSRPIV